MSSRATIEEVAALAGVSRSTVSRVVNGSTAVSPEALTAVNAAIAQLSYVPNRAARSLASRQTHAIALIVPEDTERFFGDPFFALIAGGVTARLNRSDYLLNLLVARDDPGDKMTSFVRDGGVDGAIIVSHHTSDDFLDHIVSAVPVVFGGRPVREREDDYVIDVDNVRGGHEATQHLIARGCRRIATITGPLTMPAPMDRRQGFLDALSAAGLAPLAEANGSFTETGGALAMRQLLALPAPPDGVFIASDLMARGALAVLRNEEVRIPEDIAIVGFDDTPIAQTVTPQLTTIRQPVFHQGETLASVLLDRLAGRSPAHMTTLPTELIVRESA